ncbi:MAG: LTA synthase family protein [Oscillospiraceae bacterium]|nr:LTA synthase family protein [Oscillospiraceae bacterium]
MIHTQESPARPRLPLWRAVAAALLAALMLAQAAAVVSDRGLLAFPALSPDEGALARQGFAPLSTAAALLALMGLAQLCLLAGLLWPRLWRGGAKAALGRAWLILSPLLLYCLVENTYAPGQPRWHPNAWAVAGACLLGQLALFLLLGRSAPGQIVSGVCWWALAFIGGLKFSQRGAPLLPWDLYAATTAADVLGGYRFVLRPWDWLMLCGLGVFCLVSAVCGVRLRARPRARAAGSLACALGAAALCAALIAPGGLVRIPNLHDMAWVGYTDVYRQQGFTASLLALTRLWAEGKPDGYDPQAVRVALDGAVEVPFMEVPFMEALAGPPVNIVVVMNESLADLQAIVPFDTDAPVAARLRALAAEGISGRLHVSTLGGGTDSAEFEFLTGGNAAFLPLGTSAYQQYLHPGRGNGYSMASHLKALGYAALAMHPGNPANWGRQRVYPLLGFDRFLAEGDLPGMRDAANLLRGLYSDAALYRDVLAQLRAKPAGSRLFLFCVTMQNHGGYLPPAENIPAVRALTPAATPEVDSYLSLAAESDRALGELADALRAWPEPTLLCFFGDHQPTVSAPLFAALTGADLAEGSPAQVMKLYQTPFVIWSNRGDLAPLELGDISSSYLGGLLLQAAGLPLSGYQRFLTNARAQWPVVTAQGAMDAGGRALGVSEALAASETLRGYEAAQYNLLFDVEHKQTAAFE